MKNPNKMTGAQIREAFLQYFKEHGHTVVASSSLVPFEDPTLLFTNAGMNQFKDVFLGKAKRSYTRATTCQKVVRAGGKHNDLENVGRTARHHTFFEMLGNFSFGDYFKKEAISFAWDFLTNVIGLDDEHMFVTVYKDDDEAFNIWRDLIGLPEEKILRKGEKDNFWQMGDTGPCGPCSEIHIDRGPETGCRRPDCSPDCDCDRHLELWNLVFMQYNRDEKGELHPLPKPSIDTGLGLERIASVVQNVESNYDTDLILPIIHYIADMAGLKYNDDPVKDVSMRVIADHARSTTFLVADGVLPSNEGRGYVLRRIMRRAMRHGNMLGMESVFFYKVCAFVIDFMKGHYVELTDKKAFVEKVVQSEEEAFSRTLNTGLKIIREEILDKLPANSVVTGEMIFKLYDTHGFPVDLLQDIIEDAGFSMDMDGFNKFMAKQQELAKSSSLGLAGRNVSDTIIRLGSALHSKFIGYDNLTASSRVVAIVQSDNEVSGADKGEIELITAETPFYPEGGGQIGDTGSISSDKCHMEVYSTYKTENIIVHKCRIINGSVNVGDSVELRVNCDRRGSAQKNHTATHLLHKALQTVLGDHARQAGSYVSADMLRFDFTHFGQVTQDELERISDIVNEAIDAGYAVNKHYMSQADAVKSGAMALFGEKYGDEVRVVEVGDFSRELCGGCHVDNSSKIGAFVIVSESSIASGVRRIEALTGLSAIKYLKERSKMLSDITQILKSSPEEAASRVEELQEQIKDKDKYIKEIQERSSLSHALESLKAMRNVNGVNIVTVKFDSLSADSLRNVADRIVDHSKEPVIVLVGSVSGDKVNFVCRVAKELTDRYKAGALIREVARVAGGSGGGRDDMAQAGGKEPSKIDDALQKIYELV